MENLKMMMKLSNCLMCQRELFDDDSLKIDLFYEFCCLDIIEHLKHIDLIDEISKVQQQHHQPLQPSQQPPQPPPPPPQQNGFHVPSSPIVTNAVSSTTGNGETPSPVFHYNTNGNNCSPNNFRNFDMNGSPLYSSSDLAISCDEDDNSLIKSPYKSFPPSLLANGSNQTLTNTGSLVPWINRDEIGQQNLKLPCDPLKLWDSCSEINMKRNMFEIRDQLNADNVQSLDYYFERRKRILEAEAKNDVEEIDDNDDDGSGDSGSGGSSGVEKSKTSYYRSLSVAIAAMRSNVEQQPDDDKDNYDDENTKNGNEDINNNKASSSDSCSENIESKLDHAARLHRASASIIQTNHKWSGILPRSDLSLQKIYSVKVFVGGLPWDIREKTLADAFRKFGHVTVDWPGKENAIPNPRGYAYVVFEDEERVRELLAETTRDPIDANRKFFMVPTIKKNIEIVPWPICDSIYQVSPQTKPDCSNTVFVGALHGLLTAAHLAHIMSELFGETVFVGLDTDRNRYPIGSGRVIFQDRAAFMKSIAAGYVEIKTNKFAKKIQIDPYLEEKLCSVCSVRPGIYFCRQVTCLDYYCRICWENIHEKDFGEHQPIMRKFR